LEKLKEFSALASEGSEQGMALFEVLVVGERNTSTEASLKTFNLAFGTEVSPIVIGGAGEVKADGEETGKSGKDTNKNGWKSADPEDRKPLGQRQRGSDSFLQVGQEALQTKG
jgi:hypothetical protein